MSYRCSRSAPKAADATIATHTAISVRSIPAPRPVPLTLLVKERRPVSTHAAPVVTASLHRRRTGQNRETAMGMAKLFRGKVDQPVIDAVDTHAKAGLKGFEHRLSLASLEVAANG